MEINNKRWMAYFTDIQKTENKWNKQNLSWHHILKLARLVWALNTSFRWPRGEKESFSACICTDGICLGNILYSLEKAWDAILYSLEKAWDAILNYMRSSKMDFNSSHEWRHKWHSNYINMAKKIHHTSENNYLELEWVIRYDSDRFGFKYTAALQTRVQCGWSGKRSLTGMKNFLRSLSM